MLALIVILIYPSHIKASSNIKYDSIRSGMLQAKKLIEKEMHNSATALLRNELKAYETCSDCKKRDTNKNLYAEINYLCGYAYYHVANHEQSLASFYEIVKAPGISPYFQMKALMGIANVFLSCKNLPEAQKSLTKALKINTSTLNDYSAYWGIYNNLSSIYATKGNYDTALLYLNKAQDMITIAGDTLKPEIFSNFANIYQMTGRYEQAEHYYNEAIQLSKKIGNKFAEAQTLTNLGVLYMRLGHKDKAFHQFQIAKQISESIGSKQLSIKLYKQLSKYYEDIGDYKQALTYARMLSNTFDSVYNVQNSQNIERLLADFEIYQIETTQQLLERDLTISKDKIFRQKVNVTILSILALGALLLAFYNIRRLIRTNRAYKELHERLSDFQSTVDEQKAELVERFQSELELKHNELTTNALLLVKSEGIANDIMDKLLEFKQMFHKDEKALRLINEMEHTVKELYIGKGWDEFRYCFEQVNAAFYNRLDMRYPDLTPSDRRFAALLSLNLTTKEIAILTNRSIRGVETSKFRLKKKMKLGADENLLEMLISIK